MALRKKWDALLDLKPDLAVIPEAENQDRVCLPDGMGLSYEWIGNIAHKGLGLVGREPLILHKLENIDDALQWVLPVRASESPSSFGLLGVWAMNHRATRRAVNDRQVEAAVDAYSGAFAPGRMVVAGDFNNSVFWDKPNRSGRDPRNFTTTVETLRSVGLVSAYHHVLGIPFGEEPHPTLYWKTQVPGGPTYHIDYCFIPEAWIPWTKVKVGSYDDWIGNGISDHAPLIVDVADEAWR